MNWIKGVISATSRAVLASLRRIAVFVQDSLHGAYKRWWVTPIAAGIAIGIGVLSPIVLGSLIALMVNDTEAHPVIRLVVDIAAVSVAVTVAVLAPAVIVVASIIPIADLANRWIDEVVAEKGRLDAEGSDAVADSCREGQPSLRPADPAAAR